MRGDEEGNSPPGIHCRGLGYVYSFEIRRRADDGTVSVTHTHVHALAGGLVAGSSRGYCRNRHVCFRWETSCEYSVSNNHCVYVCVCVFQKKLCVRLANYEAPCVLWIVPKRRYSKRESSIPKIERIVNRKIQLNLVYWKLIGECISQMHKDSLKDTYT